LERDTVWETARELIESGTKVRIKLSGMSMFPQLKPGYYAVVEKIQLEHLQPGDILAFQQNNNYVLHRLIHVENEVCICKGDAHNYMDPPVQYQMIIGRVEQIHSAGQMRLLLSAKEKRKARRIVRFSYWYYLKAKVMIKLFWRG